MGTESAEKATEAEQANPPAEKATADSTASTEGAATQEQAPRVPAETATENSTEVGQLPDDHPVVVALKKANQEAAAARAKVKGFEDKDKSELERALDAATEAETATAAANLENERLKAAVEFGLSTQDLALLGDGPAEGFRDRAKALAERLKTVPSLRPDPNAGQETDPAGSLDEQIVEAQKAGDVQRVIHLQNQKLAGTGHDLKE